MKKAIIPCLIIVAALFSPPASAQPNLIVEGGKNLDLDTLMAGTKAERTVVLRNNGTETLHIEKVDASCGCTGTMVSNSRIETGDTGDLLITFDSKNFSGKVRKSVTLKTNDPNKQSEKIEFTAFVVQEVSVSDTRLVFKDVVVGERNEKTLSLTNNGKETLELKGYETNLDGLILKHPPAVPPGETVTLVAEFTPPVAKRVLSNNISIHTSNPNKPDVILYVFGSVKEWTFE